MQALPLFQQLVREAVVLVTLFIATLGSAQACPQSFAEYFSVFQRGPAEQQAGSWYPLRVYAPSGDTCYPDCHIVAYDFSRADVKSFPMPIFPLASTRAEMGMKVHETVKANRATVRVYIEDSDAYDKLFLFRKINRCWYLVQVNS